MRKKTDPARTRLARLLQFVRGHRRVLVILQDHPDPDSIASAAALKRLLEAKARLDVTLAATGEVARAENRGLLQFLGESIEDTASLDLAAFDLRAVVDTQPGFGNCSWPLHEPVHLILDHHPRRHRTRPGHLTDIRPAYGATATLVYEYLQAARLVPDGPLATALLYAIRTDTQDLTRGYAPADLAAILALYPHANHRLLAKIIRERQPRAYFATLAHALADCRLYGPAALVALPSLPAPDLLSELADFFLRIEGVRWVLAHARIGSQLHLSVRTDLRQGNAGELAAALVEGIGSGGGHQMLAGAQVPLPTHLNDPAHPDSLEQTIRHVELRFLRLVEVPVRTPEPLIQEGAQ